MKGLIQRVVSASVEIEGEVFSQINSGLLVFLGVEKTDTIENVYKLADKIINLRVFDDENKKMNHSLLDVSGEILVVSQFTLCANVKKGTRPSFDKAALPKDANELYEEFLKHLKQKVKVVKNGQFGSMMKIHLENDGPVTFLIEK